MTEMIGWFSRYKTTATDTSEIVLGSAHGIMSIKVQRTANGHKIAVRSGFDPRCWDMDGELPASGSMSFWEHKYVNGIHKSAAKWGGMVQNLGPLGTADILAQIAGIDSEAESYFRDASIVDATVSEHWQMLHGQIDPKSSNPTATTKANAVRATVEDTKKQRMAADAEWGIF